MLVARLEQYKVQNAGAREQMKGGTSRSTAGTNHNKLADPSCMENLYVPGKFESCFIPLSVCVRLCEH